MEYVVYILQSDLTGSFYIGQTQDIDARLNAHNQGTVRSTKLKRPWTMVYKESYATRAKAMNREKQLKSMKKRAFIQKLISKMD